MGAYEFGGALKAANKAVLEKEEPKPVLEINNEITVYPNPSNGKFTIKCSKPYRVYVKDITGRAVNNITLQDQITNFDISGKPAGLYIITFELGDERVTKKLIIQ
jgi:hypothetical protein